MDETRDNQPSQLDGFSVLVVGYVLEVSWWGFASLGGSMVMGTGNTVDGKCGLLFRSI